MLAQGAAYSRKDLVLKTSSLNFLAITLSILR